MRRIWLIIAFLASAAAGGAQSATQDDDFLADFVNRTWTTEDGLPGNTVTDIFQDNLGYVYFGTYEGLVRFDGVEFDIYNKGRDEKYAFVSARAVFQASDGAIWTGSNDEGIFRIEMDSGNAVLSFSSENGLPNNSIRAICEDKNQNIWVATAGGVAYITPSFEVVIPDEAFVSEHHDLSGVCTSVLCDTLGRVWVTTMDEGGIYRFVDGKAEQYKIQDPFLENSVVTCIMQDNTENFWLGIAPHYACHIDDKGPQLFDLSCGKNEGTTVDNIVQDANGQLWFSTDTALVMYSAGKIARFTEQNGLVDSNINKVMQDREGNIWLATNHGGVQKMNRGLFRTLEHTSSVNAIAEGLDSRMWLGLDKGLACYKINSGTLSLEAEQNAITQAVGDERVRHVGIASNGDILISTYANLGQMRFSESGKLVGQWRKKDGLTGDKVRVALESSVTHDLLVGTTNGFNIIKHDSGEILTLTQKDGLPNDFIMCIYEDTADNSIWLGTDGGGVAVIRDGKVADIFNTENGLSGNIIFKITKNSDGAFWICTGTGLSRFFNGIFYNYSKANGLTTDSVFQMISDDTGTAWFTSNTGISSVSVQKLIAQANNLETALNPKTYSTSDGLKTRGPTSTALGMKDSHGRIWFPLIDGVAIYDPQKIRLNVTKPTVHIENVSLDDCTVYPNGENIVIPAGTKRVSIKYTGLSFVSSERTRFMYKLEGFDEGFSNYVNARTVSYTNLRPGKYRFFIMAVNGDNIMSAVDSSLTFVQQAYFYQKISFWVVMALMAAAIVLIIVQHKIKAMEKNERILQQRVEEQTAKINTLLLNILPEPVAQQLENDPEKTIADEVESVSVLFADIVNFTRITSGMGAAQIVTALNDLYSRFDKRAVAMHIEKIKTIGDSYMVASGLIEKDPHHAEHLIEYARGMLSDVKDFNRTSAIKFNIRIGINSGAVIAGVIGRTKYIYDIWGDTVNVASRMEHTGIPDRIHISLSTWEQCHDSVAFEEEIDMDIKGKGVMKTFFTK